MSAVGIDFGTTNSVVAHWTSSGAETLKVDQAPPDWEVFGFDNLMPSVFAHAADGTGVFGWQAKLSDSSRFEAVKRLFATQQEFVSDDSGGTLVVEEVATMLFARLKKAAEEQGVAATQAVVTVPANSRGLARHRTKICAGMGGLEVLALINEPTAAAMAYASRNPGDQQLLVFDWGGGTLDVTILRSVDGVFMERASKGLPTKGGLDFDSRLRQLVQSTVADTTSWSSEDRHRFNQAIELAKIRLSEAESTVLLLPDGDTRKVTRPMFEDSVRSLIEESRRPIEQCLSDIGAGAGSIDAVVMVGGSAKIPAVRDFVAEILGREPAVDVDPLTAVGEGAAVAAAILTGELDTNDFFVSTEHALGVITLDHQTAQETFSVLIPRNHTLPARNTDSYVPIFEDQESVRIRVIEGDPDDPVDHPDSVVLKDWVIDLPGDQGDPNRAFEISYEYDVDGILHVTVQDQATGTLMMKDEISYGVSDDKRQLVKIAERARDVAGGGTLSSGDASPKHADSEAVQLLQRAHVKVIPFLDADEAAEIRKLAQQLESANGGDVEAAKQELRDALVHYSYLF